jgi:hypothetical protein
VQLLGYLAKYININIMKTTPKGQDRNQEKQN